MIEDVYEPLARYRDEFRQKFSELAREKFRELTERSGVDVEANRALVGEIKALQKRADAASTRKTCFGCLMALGFVGAVAAAAYAMFASGIENSTRGLCILGLVAGAVLGFAMIGPFRAAAELLDRLKEKISSKKAAAWRQMEPPQQAVHVGHTRQADRGHGPEAGV